jgi:hypothetical protein
MCCLVLRQCCAMQAIPGLSPVPWWGTLFPLAVVLMVNGVKEAFDDYWRHKSDETVSLTPCAAIDRLRCIVQHLGNQLCCCLCLC